MVDYQILTQMSRWLLDRLADQNEPSRELYHRAFLACSSSQEFEDFLVAAADDRGLLPLLEWHRTLSTDQSWRSPRPHRSAVLPADL